MRPIRLFPFLLLSGVLVLKTPLAARAEIAPGDAMPPFSVQDQHEVEFTLEPGVDFLLVSFDMSTGKAANKVLESEGAEFLDEHGAVFLSNIDGMPWVGRKFALPKMRKYPHRILLADTAEREMLADFPQQEGRVTVFELDDELNVVAVRYWDPRTDSNPLSDSTTTDP